MKPQPPMLSTERMAYQRMPRWWKPVHMTLRTIYHSIPPWRVFRLLWRSYRYTWPDIR
jgi:hypothetical protein